MARQVEQSSSSAATDVDVAGGFGPVDRDEQFRLLVDSVRDYAILSLDRSGRVTSWNAGAQHIKGYTREEILGQHFSVFYPADDQASGKPAAELVVAQAEGRFEEQGWRVRKDGSRFWANVVITPVCQGGQLRGYSKVTRDITEAHEQSEALQEAADRLTTANDELRRQAAELSDAKELAEEALRGAEAATLAKSTFLATMSHEIRTPMNAVIGMTELLLDTQLDAVQRDYTETVRSSGNALLTIINDILDYSKIESGKLELELEPFDLEDLVEGALDFVAVQADDKRLDLRADIQPGCPGTLVGDVSRLRQVLVNLLANAVKFTSTGEVNLIARAAATDDERLVLELSVVDTGIGIAADRRDRLFQSFSQIETSTTRIYGGTGLGLAISARLIEAMGGAITVESEPGRGSTFSCAVPMATSEGPRLSGAHRRHDLDGLHVLVVDDNANNRRILQHQLAARGATSDAADSGPAGLRLLAEGKLYDVGLVDLDMPLMDGVDFAAALHDVPTGDELPLVLLSSRAGHRNGMGLGRFAAKMVKPVKSAQLCRALIQAVGRAAVPEVVRNVEVAPVSPLRLLLVEDNPVNQKLALLVLERLGYRPDLAVDGSEALAAVDRAPYDVVLMDVQMPHMDGLEATRRIRNELAGDAQPAIIAMTADAMAEDRRRCLQAGMDDYLSKSRFDPTTSPPPWPTGAPPTLPRARPVAMPPTTPPLRRVPRPPVRQTSASRRSRRCTTRPSSTPLSPSWVATQRPCGRTSSRRSYRSVLTRRQGSSRRSAGRTPPRLPSSPTD